MTEWDQQCSQHARREHICQVPFGEDTRKLPTRSGVGEEEYVYGGLPPTTLTLLSSICLYRRAAEGGGDSHPEKDSQLPCKKVAETILKDVWIRQE